MSEQQHTETVDTSGGGGNGGGSKEDDTTRGGKKTDVRTDVRKQQTQRRESVKQLLQQLQEERMEQTNNAPLYVNPAQFHRIMRRREARERMLGRGATSQITSVCEHDGISVVCSSCHFFVFSLICSAWL